MDMIGRFVMSALDPLTLVGTKMLTVLPILAMGLLLLLMGVWAGHWLRLVAEHVMDVIRLDDYVSRVGLSSILTRLGLGPSLRYLIGIGVYAAVLLSFVLGAAQTVGLTIVAEFVHRVSLFAPKLIDVMVVMSGGFFLGDVVGRIVQRSADANHVRGSETLMKVTHGILVIFAGIMAMEILGIDIVRIFFDSLQIILGAIGLACAIAFGVAFGNAGRDTAGKLIRDLTPTSKGIPDVKMRVVK
jgi:hypothetical protein